MTLERGLQSRFQYGFAYCNTYISLSSIFKGSRTKGKGRERLQTLHGFRGSRLSLKSHYFIVGNILHLFLLYCNSIKKTHLNSLFLMLFFRDHGSAELTHALKRRRHLVTIQHRLPQFEVERLYCHIKLSVFRRYGYW